MPGVERSATVQIVLRHTLADRHRAPRVVEARGAVAVAIVVAALADRQHGRAHATVHAVIWQQRAQVASCARVSCVCVGGGGACRTSTAGTVEAERTRAVERRLRYRNARAAVVARRRRARRSCKTELVSVSSYECSSYRCYNIHIEGPYSTLPFQ